MKVHLLQNAIHHFIESQLRSGQTDWYFPHSLVSRFNIEWQMLSDRGLRETYDQCLKSEISQRWWKRDKVDAKEMMLHLIDADPELAAIAWKDLAQPQASLDGRLSRFNYYCEQLLDIHRDQNIKSLETFHQQDASMMSLYLAGLFPATNSLYPGLDAFQSFCKSIGSPDIPKVDDLVRYMKVCTIINNFLQKDTHYVQLLESRMPPMHSIPCVPFQVTYEVVAHVASNPQ
jgi:hypothetical protein